MGGGGGGGIIMINQCLNFDTFIYHCPIDILYMQELTFLYTAEK